MHIHLPKPLHGWRAFAGEVGIIVVGVLIALAAEQLVEDWNWSHKVREARQRLAPELGEDLGQAELFDRARPCTERRLDELAQIVTDAQRTGRLPPLGTIGQPYWFTWDTGVWQSLIADQTATHFGHEELSAYTGTYQFISTIDEAGKENMEILLKEGEKLTRYKSSGKIGSGEGTKAGVTYRMADGTLVYVPESLAAP